MKGSHTLRWGIALAVIVIAGAGYWFWLDGATYQAWYNRPDAITIKIIGLYCRDGYVGCPDW